MRIKNDFLHAFFIKSVSSVLLRRREIIYGEWKYDKCICLSFDCDNYKDMELCGSIIELLGSEDVVASFAIPGFLATDFPEVIKDIINNGHEIVNHTFSHPSSFRKLCLTHIKEEVERFQELMVNTYGYLPKGFRSPHGLRKLKIELFEVLRENRMYDSSLIGYGVLKLGGVIEVPITPCPEHPLMAFDSYHHFRFPFFSSSENKVLKLWSLLLSSNKFINVFLDPIDLVNKNTNRIYLLKGMISKAKESDFIFYPMLKIYEFLH